MIAVNHQIPVDYQEQTNTYPGELADRAPHADLKQTRLDHGKCQLGASAGQDLPFRSRPGPQETHFTAQVEPVQLLSNRPRAHPRFAHDRLFIIGLRAYKAG